MVEAAGRRYVVRTYGCQMNEHDSERVAGLLEAEGMTRADDLDDADVVVLNTCCIRENADNKLYGNLGHLKSLKDRNPDLQIVVGGCLAQKDRAGIVERAPHVDVVFGTHNVHRAADLLTEQRGAGRAVVVILDGPDADDPEAFASACTSRTMSSTEAARRRPSASSRPAMRSESCSFIWHPKVRTM